MRTLYVVGTPIGNLEDISLRALRILREVGLIAAEDTRWTRKLLVRYDIKTPVTSYHEHNKYAKLEYLLGELGERDLALVSDAGMPGISDPGHELIVAATQKGIPVVAIPGPSVIVTALVVSGLPTERFTYLGFLPHKAGARQKMLETVVQEEGTLIILESPHRLLVSLKDMLTVLGDRRIAVARELTKIHEEVFRGRLSQAIEHFTSPKGEFTLVVAGRQEEEIPSLDTESRRRLGKLKLSGVKAREAVAQLARETGLPRRELYRAWLRVGKEGN